MGTPTHRITRQVKPPLPILFEDMPILYEDEEAEELDMGEADFHATSAHIVYFGVKAHLAGQPGFRVFFNLNCYYANGPRYKKTGSLPYFTADVMIVSPQRDLGELVSSYKIDNDCPPPVLVVEVLSERSAQQSDLDKKIKLYAHLGIAEYLLVDATGRFLPELLLIKRLRRNRTWKDEQDADGGVTSKLGFRIIIEDDGRVRVLDAGSGKRYIRPDEAEQRVEAAEQRVEAAEQREAAAAAARRQADERIRQLEAELERLRNEKPATRKRKS